MNCPFRSVFPNWGSMGFLTTWLGVPKKTSTVKYAIHEVGMVQLYQYKKKICMGSSMVDRLKMIGLTDKKKC